MERSFGRSFGAVRVHTDGAAGQVAASHDAEALTIGDKIAFGPGRFRPGTAGGDHLIAHELAHVAQQGQSGGGAVAQASSLTSTPSEPAERAAEAAAGAVSRGEKVTAVGGASGLSTRQRIYRRALKGARRLPAVTLSTPQPGARAKAGDAARGAPTAAANSFVSPAGDRPVATVGKGATLERGAAGKPRLKTPEQHSPDQAQAPIPESAAAPVSALVAGAPAGAGAEDVKPGAEAGKEGEKKDGKAKGKEDKEEKKEKEEKEKKKEEAEGKEGGGRKKKKKRKFGQVPGSRGAGAAKAAIKRLGDRSKAMQHHEPAGDRVEQARAAAVPPANEGTSRAQGKQVGTVAGTAPPEPDRSAVTSDVKANVEAAAPSNMNEMGKMASSGATQRIGSQLTAAVSQQAAGVRTSLEQINTPPPAQEPAAAVPQPEPEAAPGTETPNLAGATPPPVPEESLDASEFTADADAELGAHDIDDETLGKAKEGPLAELAGQKKELDQAVDSSGEKARAGEGPALEGARGELDSQEGSADADMASTREGEQKGVLEEQEGTRTGEEGGRGTASQKIEDIYKKASEDVTTKLDGMGEKVETRFTETQEQYLKDFGTETRDELEDFKDDRYSGALGWTKWLKDRWVSINELSKVKAIYSRNRERYITRIDTLIGEITADVETTISDSKKILEDAKVEIEKLVADLPKDLQEEARKAQERVLQRFSTLEKQVAQAEKQAKSSLQRLRKQAIDAVDKELEKIKSENEALLDKLANFVKKLAELLGKFLALMTRVTRMGVGSFISSALSQAQEGIKKHLWGALQQAFKEWVFRKIPFLEPLLNLPPNWMEMLAGLALSLPALFMEHLPSMLPAIGVAAMIWLSLNLAAKLIPGAGAIMAVIDGIRAAWGLVQSLFSAAEAFFGFVMKVAQPANGAAQFALALARGIVAGLEAVLTFLGVDRLIMRVGKTVAKPFGKIFKNLSARLKKMRSKRKKDRKEARGKDRAQRRKGGKEKPKTARQRRRERSKQRDRRRQRRRSRRPANQRRPQRRRNRSQRRDDRRRKREQRKMERWRKGMAAVDRFLAKHGNSESRALTFRAGLALIRVRYRFKTLRLVAEGGNWVLAAGMSPFKRQKVNRKIVKADMIDPAFPPASKVGQRKRQFQISNSGNVRLFAWDTKNPDISWVWKAKSGKAKKGSWQPVAGKKKSAAVKAAEKAARAKLATKKKEFVDLVDSSKHENAQGFDAAGIGKEQGSSQRRLFIGESKQSDAKKGRNFGVEKFTATTGSRLGPNFAEAESQAKKQGGTKALRQVRSALKSGRVTFIVFISGDARVSKNAMKKLKTQILSDMRKFLKVRFPTLTAAERNKVIREIEVIPKPVKV
ncbi:MAG: DUF4157 domain-containing protein [Deltaproteobacteria bacterium]|nr:DUF4157 domain-containing protein [Deltaproteobacteria bacterium]